MDEFLKQNYFILTYSVEILAAVVGLLSYRKYNFTPVKYFIYFLVYAALGDYLGGYPSFFRNFNIFHLIENTVFEKNYLYYTLYWGIGSALFYLFFYKKILNNLLRKRILNYMGILFLVFSILHLSFNFQLLQNEFLVSVFIFGALIIIACICFYFVEILESDKVLTFYKSIYFWISAVILIWFLITTPLIFYEIYFSTADWNFILLKWQIYLFANMFMYLSFSFALLWCKPQND